MATEYMMPQLGLTMTEGTVTKWFKDVGDTVAVGDILVEVATDKITNQLESPLEGTLLEILVPEGTAAPVKAPLAVIGKPGENVERSGVPDSTEQKAPVEVESVVELDAARTDSFGERLKASPIAKKIAGEQGIDLSVVTGTGPDGRIVERDVLGYIERNKVKASPLAAKLAGEHGVDLAAIAKDSRIMKDDVLAAIPKQQAVVAAATAGTPLTGMRKVIAERMSLSWQTCPHVHNTVEVDMTEALALKDKIAQLGTKISLTEIIIKAAAQTLMEFPMVNNALVDGKLVVNTAVNIGVAVALDNGLIVPVIRDANRKSLSQLRAEVVDLSGKARQGKLLPDDYTGGTFTVSNLGMYGVDHFTPIVNPPEAAILGVCRTVERPVVVDATIVIRPMMNLVLGYDHRLVDGALAGQFMARLRKLLEQPLLML